MARKMTFRRIFSHRGQRESFNIRITVCASRPAEAMHSPDNQATVVAVWHKPESPEMYVGNVLLYPKVHSGSLALVHDRLGPKQVDFEHSDDEGIGDEEEIFEETEGVQSEALGDVEGDWFSFRGSFIVVGLRRRNSRPDTFLDEA
jgi:hypothetical protein